VFGVELDETVTIELIFCVVCQTIAVLSGLDTPTTREERCAIDTVEYSYGNDSH
jgi:hypothetical protein